MGWNGAIGDTKLVDLFVAITSHVDSVGIVLLFNGVYHLLTNHYLSFISFSSFILVFSPLPPFRRPPQKKSANTQH
jgi:hypothetical protein